MIDIEETQRHGSVGRLAENMEAKIVDPVTGEALPPGQRGELWLRGPTVMKGDQLTVLPSWSYDNVLLTLFYYITAPNNLRPVFHDS